MARRPRRAQAQLRYASVRGRSGSASNAGVLRNRRIEDRSRFAALEISKYSDVSSALELLRIDSTTRALIGYAGVRPAGSTCVTESESDA